MMTIFVLLKIKKELKFMIKMKNLCIKKMIIINKEISKTKNYKSNNLKNSKQTTFLEKNLVLIIQKMKFNRIFNKAQRKKDW
jgi:hypothetical protein